MKKEPNQTMTAPQFDISLPSLLHQFVQTGGSTDLLEMINQFDADEVIRINLELMGTNVALLNLIATLNFQKKHYDFVLPYLHAANQIDPENQDTLYNLGIFLNMIKETKLAIYYLKQLHNPDADALEILASEENETQPLSHREHALRYLQAKRFTSGSAEVGTPTAAPTAADQDQKLAQVRSLIQSGKLEVARLMAYNELQKNPTHAQWWMFLGEALHAQGQKAAAWKAYDRAWLLDPQAAWVEEVKKEVASHRSGKIPNWLTDLLHVPTVTVTAAMIVKNEERFIGDSIRALLPAVDEIVVVDTGSTDRTVEIATELGAKVFHYEWDDNFAAARNFGLDKVTSDWVLWVDADEFLLPEDVGAPRTVAGLFHQANTPQLFCVTVLSQIENIVVPNYDIPRLFPSGFGIRYWRRIHEQLAIHSEDGKTRMIAGTSVRIRLSHEGYQPSVMVDKNKLIRNIQLLSLSVEEYPDDLGAWGFLGRDLCLNKQYEDAVHILSHTEQLAEQQKSERFRYGRLTEVRQYLMLALEHLGRHDEVPAVLDRLLQDSPDFPDAWFRLGNAKMEAAKKLLQEAGEAFLQAHQAAPKYRGIVPYDVSIGKWRAAAQMADVHVLQGDWVQATKLYEQILPVASSPEFIQSVLENIKKQVKELNRHFSQSPVKK